MKAFQKFTFIVCLPAAMLLLSAQASHAGSATWSLNPGSGDWNIATNWTPATVPNGPGDTATFDLSNTTGVSLSTFTEVNGIVFNAGASAFTITVSPGAPLNNLFISGVGITNNSGITQNFVTAVDGTGNIGRIQFSSATAGSLTAFTNNGGAVSGFGGQMFFTNASTAGNGTFTNNGAADSSGATGGFIDFLDTSTAGNGTFTSNGGAVSGANGGIVQFVNSSTAGNGTFISNGSAFSGTFGGRMAFIASSTAGNGTFINNGGTVSGATGGFMEFLDTSTAGNATFTSNGGTVSGANGGFMDFFDTSTAGDATLIANGGLGGGGGGLIRFFADSTGGTARVEVFGNGSLDLTGHNAPGMTVGSIEGNGAVILAANNLTVGSNNLSTNFSGSISGGGSLAKIGIGTLTFSGANFYSGGTSINAGTLEASQDGAVGFGDVSVTAPGATLRLQTGATNNYIADIATLSVVSGSTVDLNFSGSADTISGLLVDGVAQPTGLYGSVGSGAPHELPEFAGTGRIQVGVLLPPVITSPSTATAAVNQAFSYQITATNNPTSFDAAGLPANLTVDTSTGLISGTPAAAGIFSITLSATNADGTGTAPLTLTVNPPPPVITSPSTATAAVNQAFSYQITATNNPTSFDATGLPANLTVDTSTGLISGTPAAAGSFPINLSATNAGGTGTATLTLTINPAAPVITSPLTATATVGQPFTYQITATNSPTSFDAIGLPAPLTVDTSTGLISGTPTAAGSFPINLSATNAGGTGTATLTLTINPPAPVITSPLSATATVGQPFTYQITATNSPTSFDATGLPAPLTVDTSTGLISGTPSAAGTFSVNLSATNAGGTGTATAVLTVTVPSPPGFTSPLSAITVVGLAFSYQPEATGAPTFSVDEATLPPGLAFDSTLVALVGNPTIDGLFHVKLIASNLDGTTTAILDLTVQKAPLSGPVITSITSATGKTGTYFTFQVLMSGGSSEARLTIDGLPAGLNADLLSGQISGVAEKDGSSLVTLTVTDGDQSNTATLQLTFTSDPAVPVIVSSNTAVLVPDQFFSYTIVTDGGENLSYAVVGPLPLGLTFDPEKGIISGIPQLASGSQRGPDVAGGVITNVALYAIGSSSGTVTLKGTNQLVFFLVSTGARNISTRAYVDTGDKALIAGFIIRTAPLSTPAPMKLILRAIGPSLSTVPNPLANPFLSLHSATTEIAANDDWMDNLADPMGKKGTQTKPIQDTTIPPTNPLESAILAVLNPGTYTAIVSGTPPPGTNGVGVVEVYNLATQGTADGTDLANISTRGYVQTGANVMIGGFIHKRSTSIKVVIRAIGPSLASSGISDPLPDPALDLNDANGNVIATNDDWKSNSAADQAIITGNGLAPVSGLESVIVATLPQSTDDIGIPYTATVKGSSKNPNPNGVGLVEAYFLP